MFDNFAPGQINAFMRHVYTAFGSATAMLLFVGISQGDVTTIGNAIHQIGDGITSIVAGIAALVPVVAGIRALISAGRPARLKAMDADPQIEKVITKPDTSASDAAAAIPGNKVV